MLKITSAACRLQWVKMAGEKGLLLSNQQIRKRLAPCEVNCVMQQEEESAKQQVRRAGTAKFQAQAELDTLDGSGAGANATSIEGDLRDAEQTQRECEEGVRQNQERVRHLHLILS